MVMSAASSGGVSSSVAWIAAMMSASGAAIALADLLAGQLDLARQPGHQVAAADRVSSSSPSGDRRADGELDRLGALGADRHPVLEPDVVGDRVVEVVAADAQRARDDDAAERDHRHLARAAADVDDHAPDRLGDRRSPAPIAAASDSSIRCTSRAPRRQRRLLDRPALDLGDRPTART